MSEAIIDEQQDVPPAECSPTFEVTDEGSANWVVRRVVEARAYAERVERWAAAETARARREEAWFMARFGGQLQTWLRGELASGGHRRRSVKLPAGQIGFRLNLPAVQVHDRVLASQWCRLHLPDALRYRVSAQGVAAVTIKSMIDEANVAVDAEDAVALGVIRTHLNQVGELPEGVSLGGAEEAFFVR